MGPESIFGLDLVGCNSSDKENYSKQIRENFRFISQLFITSYER